MAKTWILDSETKGTGAHMVPLEDARSSSRGESELSLITLRRLAPPVPAPGEPARLRFKLVDVMSARVLGEDVDAREAVRLLEGMRSVVDARVFVWVARTERWRMLSLDQHKALWHFRGRAQHAYL